MLKLTDLIWLFAQVFAVFESAIWCNFLRSILYVLIILPVLFISTVQASPIPATGDGGFGYEQLEYVLVDDPKRADSIPSAIEWQQHDNRVPNFGFTHSTLWLRFSVVNPETASVARLLEVGYPLLSRVEMIHMAGEQELGSLVLGNNIDFRSRPIDHRNLIFPLTFPPDSVSTVYLKVQGGNGLQVPLALWDDSHFWQADQRRISWLNLYYGLMVAMILYNLFLVWGIRDIAYLYYVFAMASVLIFQTILHGTAFQNFWPDYPNWNAMSIAFFIPIVTGCANLFSNKMLRIQQVSPVLYRLVLLQLITSPLLALASLVFPYLYVVPISTFMTAISASTIAYLGIRYWSQYAMDARIFTVAWNIFLLGTVGMALSKFSLLPYNWFTHNLVQIGSAIETILLSLALAARINRLREDRLNLEKGHFIAREKEIKAEKELMEAKFESKAKSDFLAVMSHEIRTPMNGVLGVLDLMKDTPLNKEQSRMIGTIESSGRLLLNILNDILDISKIESGKLDLESIPMSLHQIINDAVSIYDASARQKKLVVASFISPSIKTPLIGDPTRIKQVVFNLVGNAIKFTEQGHVFIKAVCSEDDAKYQKLRIEVMDSGIGLSESAQRKLFQSFNQADRSTSRKFGGTGLGLAISKRLVEAMGGEIGVISDGHAGSTFWVDLKLLIDRSGRAIELDPDGCQLKTNIDYLPLEHFLKDCLSSEVIEVQLSNQQQQNLKGATDKGAAHKSASQVICQENGSLCWVSDADTESGQTYESPFNINAWLGWEPVTCSRAEGLEPSHQSLRNRNLRVLVAEDNAVNQMVIRELLKPLVEQLDMASNGVEAVHLFSKCPACYDYVLMDCEMPEMDGYEATRRIREFERKHGIKPVKIVALTAHAFEEFKDRAFKAGMNAHLPKPLNRALLTSFFEEDLSIDGELDNKQVG